MEATGVYPNWPPVLATTGLGGSLAGTDPDHVPLEPDLINDSRRRYAAHGGAVDASGVLRLHVRNAQGYAYLRPHKQAKLSGSDHMHGTKTSDVTAQAMYYRRNYRHYVPDELLTHHLQRESPPEEDAKHIPKRQGNALAGVDRGPDGHIVFYPTGQVLQQACAWYSGGEMESDKACTSSTVETGAAIRQYAVMGGSDAYFSTGNVEIYAAARGAANCTILATPARATTGSRAKMRAKAKLSFPEMLYHVAGSPHVEAELAFVTGDGAVRRWDPEGGVQTVKSDPVAASDHFLRCEYSSHPCVLWAANRFTVTSVDLRQPAQPATQRNTLFDLAGVGSAFADIYGLKRRTSCPFQFIVGSGVAIELLDSRMAKQPLMSWSSQANASGGIQSSFGAIDEVDLRRNDNDDRGFIVSTSQRSKVATLYPFERNRKRARSKVLSLTSLRSTGGDEYSETKSSTIAQFVASDAPLDLELADGGEWTNLMGVCALRDGDSASASVYQLNNLGDLFSHRVSCADAQATSYHTAVQPDLPCGITGQSSHSDESVAKTMPLPSDAILPEHDTDSLATFTMVPIKVLLRKFPRLPDGGHLSGGNGDIDDAEPAVATKRPEEHYDEALLAEKLAVACRPSASLARLHRYVVNQLKLPLSSQELLLFLRSRSEFRIWSSSTPLDTLRVLTPPSSRNSGGSVHWAKDDVRLAACSCHLETLSPDSPCKSLSCVIPHSLIISGSSSGSWLDKKTPSTAQQPIPDEFAAAIEDARAAYGRDNF